MADLLPGWSTERLDGLASDVRDQGKRLDDGIATQANQAVDIAAIKKTLEDMQSAEMAELRRRADFPRRLLYALGVPLAAATGSGLLLIIFSGGHIG